MLFIPYKAGSTMQIFDKTMEEILNQKLKGLEDHFQADVIFYCGPIAPGIIKYFRDFIEKLVSHATENLTEKLATEDGTTLLNKKKLVIVLNTPGGVAEAVEKMVEIIRFHYAEVYFVVPDIAMSAGTIFCMSGNKIYMDYSSSLGPIDPQIPNGNDVLPALGYLDQVEKLIEKSKMGNLTTAEIFLLQKLDLAELNRYEQAKNLTITLLKNWLVGYKFADWEIHNTNPNKKGQPVTPEEKQERAEEIANLLSNNKIWHSHGRMIGVRTLETVLRLKIEDYSNDKDLRDLIRSYNDLIIEYVNRSGLKFFLHSKNSFFA